MELTTPMPAQFQRLGPRDTHLLTSPVPGSHGASLLTSHFHFWFGALLTGESESNYITSMDPDFYAQGVKD